MKVTLSITVGERFWRELLLSNQAQKQGSVKEDIPYHEKVADDIENKGIISKEVAAEAEAFLNFAFFESGYEKDGFEINKVIRHVKNPEDVQCD